jgi:hypothetical protein
MTEIVTARKQWPDFYDYQQQLDTWREVRADFADGVEVWEWALVDRAYAHLHRTAQLARPGEPCKPSHLEVIEELRERVARAREVVLSKAGSGRELDRLVKVLGAGRAEGVDPRRRPANLSDLTE